MTSPADLVAVEDAWVAEPIVEQPLGSNHTRLGVEFGWDSVAWCAITQTLAIGHAFGFEVFRSAAVSAWIDAAKRGVNGLRWIPADGWIEPGMLATFDFGPANGHPKGNPANFHISMVRDPGTQGKFQTDGGNEGDAMRQQWRDRTYVQGFIGLPFSPRTPPPSHQEHDMTPGQCRDHNPAKNGGPRKWFFTVSDSGILMAQFFPGGATPFPIGGVWTSGVDAYCEDDGRLVVAGRAADGQLQQCVIYTDGNTVKPPGTTPEFELLGGHIYPPAP